MSKDLELRIKLDAINKASGPLKMLMGDTAALGKQLKATNDILKEFEGQQRKIEQFSGAVENARKSSAAYKEQQAAVAALNSKLEQHRVVQNKVGGEAATLRKSYQSLFSAVQKMPSPPAHILKNLALQKAALDEVEGRYLKVKNAGRRLRDEIKDGERSLKSAKQAKDQYGETLKRLTTELKDAGLSTKGLGEQQAAIKSRLETTTAAIERQKEVLRKMHAANAAYDKAMETRNKFAGSGVSLMATGAAMGAPIVKAVQDYSAFEDAMLGVARQVEGARNSAGQLTPVYYEMGEAIKSMAERIPMATTEIAALIEAGAKMGIQGKENLLTFAETTAITATAFDLPADQVGEDMAKLAQLYKVPIANIAELGDAINWLDDGAQSGGADIIDVMKRIAGTADGLGMAYQEAAALGSTFLSLGAGAEVAASASNAMMRELSIATMQSKKFQAGMQMVGLDSAQIQLGMSKDSTGTILKVLEAIRALPQEKQIEATTRLFGKEFGDDAAKLANNLDEYRKQLALVRDEEAKGSMGREAAAKNQALSAQYQMVKNSLFNVTSALGQTLQPALVEIMQATSGLLGKVREWVKENPGLASALMKTAAAAAVIVTVLGGLALGVAAVIGPFAMLRYAFAMAPILAGPMLAKLMLLKGALGTVAGWGVMAGKALFSFGATVLPIVGKALWFVAQGFGNTIRALWMMGQVVLPMVGKGILFIGRALLMNPIGLFITGIVGAAFLIYKYWGPISNFFGGLWNGITTVARLAWGELTTWFASLPATMMTIGGQIIDGLWQGLASKWEGLKAKVAEIANSISGAVKGALGIHSPSRVFAELGGYTMQGLQMGLQAAAAGPLGAVTKVAGNLATAGAVALGASMPALAVDNRPPITAAQAAGGGGMAAGPIQITVHAAPGMDEARLAELVAQKVAELQRNQAAAGRSRLTDSD